MGVRLGSLCTGYGGLEMGLRLAGMEFDLAFVAEIDPAASRVLATHHPDVPNLGDITEVDWSEVDSVDILTAGYQCQPFSLAGKRKGTSDVRHLWPSVAEAVRALRPSIVFLENVPGHRSLGFGRVLGDLAALGYDARWTSVRASDIGAAHQRDRVFIRATAHPDRAEVRVESGRGCGAHGSSSTVTGHTGISTAHSDCADEWPGWGLGSIGRPASGTNQAGSESR